MSNLGMTAPLPNLDDSQVLKAILVALGNVTSGGGGGGTGDVAGPASSTDSAVALWDGATGKLLKNSSVFITGGGTIGLGGFTLTVPVTGTAALLGTANVFSAVQTLPNGAVGAPALNLGDATSGFYRSASNEISISGAGTQRYKFGSTGTLSLLGLGNNSKINFQGASATSSIASNGYGDGLTCSGSLSTVGIQCTGGSSILLRANGDFGAGSGSLLGWSSTTDGAGTMDVSLARDSAGVLAQRSGTTAQINRIYGTYTDASNYVRLGLNTTSTTLTIAAETAGTGADDIDLAFTPAGTGTMKFGTHSAVAAETVTGYITIKDNGGTTRKLAVIS